MSRPTTRLTLPLAILAAIAVTYCGDNSPSALEFGAEPEVPEPPAPSAAISDAVHGGENESFFFLPPLIPDPTYTGLFDPSQEPEVEICELSAEVCVAGPPLATYTMTSGPGSETIRVNEEDGNYLVNWHTDEFVLDGATTYRIRVLVGGEELGFADVDVIVSGGQVASVNTNDFIALKDGKTLPVKFRIEQETEVTVGTSGGEISTPDGAVTLVVPAGALTEDVEISVKPQELVDDQLAVVEFGPEGLVFDQPVPVTLGYDPATLPPGVAEEDLAMNLLVDGRWRVLPDGSRDDVAKSVTAPFFHFSTGGAGPAELAIFCPGDSDPTTFETLPEALNAVIEGGTVEVCDGTHTVEGVSVSRPVTIRPVPGANPTLATSVAEETFLVGGYATGTVLIEGLTFAMMTPTASGFFPYAIRATDPYDQLVVRNVTLDIDPASRGGVRVMATTVDGGGVTLDGSTVTGGARGADVTGSRLDVVNSDFYGFSQWALLYRTPAGQSGRIESSTFTGCGKWQCVGGFFSDLEIVSNTFTAPTPTGDTNIDPTAHVNIGIQSTALIDDNDFVGCGFGACIFGGGTETQLTVTNNRLTSNGADPSKHNANHRMIVLGSQGYSGAGGLIENNEINGCLYTCIEVRERVGTTTVRGNTLTLPAGEPTWHGILGWGGLDPTIGVLPPAEDRPQLAIENNTIHAVSAAADPTNWDDYELKWGITLSNAVATSVSGNLIENAAIGIGSVEGSDLQNGTDNTIHGVQSGIYLDGGGVEWDEGRATLNFNDITDYYSSIVGKGGSAASDLQCNYWGGGGPLNRTENGGPIPVSVYTPWATAPIAGTDHSGCTLP